MIKSPGMILSHQRRLNENFYEKYLNGKGLDIGYGGSQFETIVPNAIGIDNGYPGYNGTIIPFENETQDFLYSSHCLEHVWNPITVLKEWFRVVKINGFLIVTVPHQFLYEKKKELPSVWNLDHKRFYTPGRLLSEIEEAFCSNTYRIIYLKDCDHGYNYEINQSQHPAGEFQIEIVIKKIKEPTWRII